MCEQKMKVLINITLLQRMTFYFYFTIYDILIWRTLATKNNSIPKIIFIKMIKKDQNKSKTF